MYDMMITYSDVIMSYEWTLLWQGFSLIIFLQLDPFY